MAGKETYSPLLIISGKGGVGKTTVSAALGLALARTGKRVLLVEVRGENRIPPLFEKSPAGYAEKEIAPNLYSISVTGEDAAREYLKIRLIVKLAYETLIEHPLFQFVIEAIPGLADLFSLGKIWDLHRFGHQRQKRWRYDYIILDSPPTGQGIPFLRAPEVIISTLRLGPVVMEARKIQKLLSDKSQTRLLIMTIPEEMAVSEAIEYWKRAKNELDILLGPLIINNVLPGLFSPEEKKWLSGHPGIPEPLAGLVEPARIRILREENQREEINRLKEEIRWGKFVEVPLFSQPDWEKKDLLEMGNLLGPELFPGFSGKIKGK
ncbi:MAG: ArsA family ATPase [Proteobacteria bacterium]|nr:ArsA family ATPase [Pseudomonadota bacterium]